MEINRRKFLKGAASAPLAKLAIDSQGETSEGETSKEKTSYVGKFAYDMAIHDLDFAEKFLNEIMNREYTGPHGTYASNIGSATRFIHFGVWSQRPKISKVEDCYIPLLKKARDSIDINDPVEIKKHDPSYIKNNADYPTSAMHHKACIQGRIYNLENYCDDEMSDSMGGFERVKREGKYQFIED